MEPSLLAHPITQPNPIPPLQINDEKYAALIKALRPKITRALQDLQVNPTKARMVMGGATQTTFPQGHESFGPIV